MPDNASSTSRGASGAKESFWDEYYREERYQEEDGTVVPVYDQILREHKFQQERFDPSKGGYILSKGNLPF